MNREAMEKIYLSYRDEFLTIDRCAEWHGLDPDTVLGIVNLYRDGYERIRDIEEVYSDLESPSDIINFK